MRLALALLFVLGCSEDDPALDAPQGERPSASSRSTPAVEPSESATSAHGLRLPAGSVQTASNSVGDDFVVSRPPSEVAAFVREQITANEGSERARPGEIFEFRRITPRDEDPAVVRLFVLVMPYAGRGTLLRVQRLPAVELSPEQLRENIERFEREQYQLD